jgi:hypothetical protein
VCGPSTIDTGRLAVRPGSGVPGYSGTLVPQKGSRNGQVLVGALTGLIGLEGLHTWLGEGIVAMLLPVRDLPVSRFASAWKVLSSQQPLLVPTRPLSVWMRWTPTPHRGQERIWALCELNGEEQIAPLAPPVARMARRRRDEAAEAAGTGHAPECRCNTPDASLALCALAEARTLSLCHR